MISLVFRFSYKENRTFFFGQHRFSLVSRDVGPTSRCAKVCPIRRIGGSLGAVCESSWALVGGLVLGSGTIRAYRV